MEGKLLLCYIITETSICKLSRSLDIEGTQKKHSISERPHAKIGEWFTTGCKLSHYNQVISYQEAPDLLMIVTAIGYLQAPINLTISRSVFCTVLPRTTLYITQKVNSDKL